MLVGQMLASIERHDIALFGIFLLVTVIVLAIGCIVGVRISRRKNSLSPYSHKPLRLCTDFSYTTSLKVLSFLYHMHQYDNRIFSLKKASFCRETGRIFPDSVTWYGKVVVDWSFLNKRFPGKYVSWGSLTIEQQDAVLSVHDTVEGFQTDFSSPVPQPSNVEAKYAFAKPGPLYVDIETNVLLGWKEVPDTDLEVLVVQKPVHLIHLTVT